MIWKVQNLSAGYDPAEGFIEAINFEMKRGERVALLGGERSGSSLFLKVLCGLRPRRSGSLDVLGETIPQLQYYDDWDHMFSREIRVRLGVSLEKDGLLGNVSLREGLKTVQTFGNRQGVNLLNDRQRIDHLCELFALQDVATLRPHHLSSAERRFAALARAALLDPDVLMFEAPSKNLDDSDRERLFYACDRLIKNANKSLVVVTEDWAFAMRYCTRLIVMDHGKLVFDGTWSELSKGVPEYWNKISASLKRRWELDAPLREVV